MDAGAFFRFRRELFQTKVKIHKRLFAFLLVFALVIGLLPSVLADNEPDISAAESAEEALVDSRQEDEPAIAPPTQSILESDEAVEDSEVETEDEAPTSMDGETLTRMDNDGLMLLGGGGTMGKSTCVTFAAYQSARWKCHRYEVDGSHSYGHYFYTSEIAYHTIDGVDSFCIEPNTSSLNGQYYSSYTAEEASSSSYWKLELDALQRSHIQKILAFGYAILFIRGAKPVMDQKYDLMKHPAIRQTSLGGGAPYIHHSTPAQMGTPLFAPMSHARKEHS